MAGLVGAHVAAWNRHCATSISCLLLALLARSDIRVTAEHIGGTLVIEPPPGFRGRR